MEQNFWTAFTASLIAGAVTTSGIFAIRRYEEWARQNITYFACFAAGVLIAVSFLHIIPTSFAMNSQAPMYLFAGYLFMHVFNRFLTAYVCDKPETAEYALRACSSHRDRLPLVSRRRRVFDQLQRQYADGCARGARDGAARVP